MISEELMSIMFMYGGNGYFASAFSKNLTECNCKVCEIKVDSRGDVLPKGEFNALIIYLSDAVIGCINKMVLLKDHAADIELPIYVIGTKEELDAVRSYFADTQKVTIFERPIDTREVIGQILRNYGNDSITLRKKILCVDDSGVSLRLLKDALGGKYQVLTAMSGMQAIKVLGKTKPDLIILDYEMPACNGNQLLEMIREDIDCSEIPVVFYTGHTSTSDTIECMQKGIAGYVLKTTPMADVRKMVDNFFVNKRIS